MGRPDLAMKGKQHMQRGLLHDSHGLLDLHTCTPTYAHVCMQMYRPRQEVDDQMSQSFLPSTQSKPLSHTHSCPGDIHVLVHSHTHTHTQSRMLTSTLWYSFHTHSYPPTLTLACTHTSSRSQSNIHSHTHSHRPVFTHTHTGQGKPQAAPGL